MRFVMNFKKLPRCGAKARSNNGQPCRQAAMQNGRCYYHGGSTPIKHGRYSKTAEKQRTNQRCFIDDAKELNQTLEKLISSND